LIEQPELNNHLLEVGGFKITD